MNVHSSVIYNFQKVNIYIYTSDEIFWARDVTRWGAPAYLALECAIDPQHYTDKLWFIFIVPLLCSMFPVSCHTLLGHLMLLHAVRRYVFLCLLTLWMTNLRNMPSITEGWGPPQPMRLKYMPLTNGLCCFLFSVSSFDVIHPLHCSQSDLSQLLLLKSPTEKPHIRENERTLACWSSSIYPHCTPGPCKLFARPQSSLLPGPFLHFPRSIPFPLHHY